MTGRPASTPGNAGFTLIELIVAMGLFALIAVAGLALVQSIMRVQGRTEARLDRLAQIQRAMFVVTGDLDQVSRGPITGGEGQLRFTRAAPGVGGVPVEVTYSETGGTLVRSLGPVPQLLLPGVRGARWLFWNGAWVDHWPVDEQAPGAWPAAIALEVDVTGAGGAQGKLRRVVRLPVRLPDAPGTTAARADAGGNTQ